MSDIDGQKAVQTENKDEHTKQVSFNLINCIIIIS